MGRSPGRKVPEDDTEDAVKLVPQESKLFKTGLGSVNTNHSVYQHTTGPQHDRKQSLSILLHILLICFMF